MIPRTTEGDTIGILDNRKGGITYREKWGSEIYIIYLFTVT